MSLDIIDDKYVLFFNNCRLEEIDERELGAFLKEVFKALSDIYLIDLFGYFKVDIYVDKKVGSYVEIEKVDDYISYSKKIDTKVMLNINSFYLKTNDLSKVFKYKPIYYLDGYYYVSTESVDKIEEIVEFCKVVYKDYEEVLENKIM